MQSGVTLITPTGDRYLAFKLCEMWMSRQTMPYNQWIVIDDGYNNYAPEGFKSCCTLGQDYVRRERLPGEPPHTLHLNLLVALPLIRYNKIMIIEDDDYYTPNYIEKMYEWLVHNHAVGQGESIYYNIRDRHIQRLHNRKHVSLCQTGFTSYNISKLEQVCNIVKREFEQQKKEPKFVDILFWRNVAGKKFIETGTPKLCIGIKGLPGRQGIGNGHSQFSCNDPNFEQLKQLMGIDADTYINVLKLPEYKNLGLDFDKINSETQLPVIYEGEKMLHTLLRRRQIRRLANGDVALLRHNEETIRMLNRCCKKIDNRTWRLRRQTNLKNFALEQKDKYKGKTCYLIGKGPGLDTIIFDEDIGHFKPDCPIIAVNESIHTVEKNGSSLVSINGEPNPSHPLYCLQQDTVLRETCWSKYGTMLLPFTLRWYLEHPRVMTYVHSDFEVRDKRFPFSIEMGIYIAHCWGCSDVVFMACDAAANGNCDYAKSVGHEPMGDRRRFKQHLHFLNRALNGLPSSYMFPSS